MSRINIDLNDYEPYTPGKRKILPAGDYVLIIIGDEFKPTKNGRGTGFLFEFEVVSGEYAGTNLTLWVNYENPSIQCQDIGRGELRAIADACGLSSPKETNLLYNIPIAVTLGIETEYDELSGRDIPTANTFDRFQRLEQTSSAQPANAPATQPATNGNQGATVPAWQR